MDVLKPEIVLVDERCYRFFDSTAWSQNRELGSYEEETFQPTYDSDEDICDSNIEIVPHSGGRYKHSFHVPRYVPLQQIIHLKKTLLKIHFQNS